MSRTADIMRLLQLPRRQQVPANRLTTTTTRTVFVVHRIVLRLNPSQLRQFMNNITKGTMQLLSKTAIYHVKC